MELTNQPLQGCSVGVVAFRGITPLDVVGPVEVLSRMSGVSISFVARDDRPISLGGGLSINPDSTFRSRAIHDVVFVPGGHGVNAAMQDEELRSFVQRHRETTRYIASVCTGALILGACGLLEGRRATTHWMSLSLLAQFGAKPVQERVVLDDPVVTGAGVSAGIDLALTLVRLLDSKEAADMIQLEIEYDPQPETDLSLLRQDCPDVLERATDAARPLLEERRHIIERLRAM